MKKKESGNRKLNVKRVINLIVIILVITLGILYYFKMPVKNVTINGNVYTSDYEILKSTNLKKYPRLFYKSSNGIEKIILKNPLIKEAKVKKNLLGKIEINVIENKILFFNRNDNRVVLSGNININPETINIGMPSLINYVPDDVFLDFVEDFDKINPSIINMISEIEYKPLYSNEKIIDEKRFLLRMNDGNEVYINTVNIKQLNNYQTFYASLGDKKGILNLDSSTKENFVFQPFSEKGIEVNED